MHFSPFIPSFIHVVFSDLDVILASCVLRRHPLDSAICPVTAVARIPALTKCRICQ